LSKFLNFVSANPSLLKSLAQGIEKEGLRAKTNASMAMTPHPQKVGSKLTHSHITTDYAENLLEFITPVFSDTNCMLNFLSEAHHVTYQAMEADELIWPWSMPCLLPENEWDIPIANYGKSNVGKLKSVYRLGLAYRYGKSMQSIAGVHYNFSFDRKFWSAWHKSSQDTRDLQTFINSKYFHLIRNYRRYSWLLIYLFGDTPLVDASFVKNKQHKLELLAKESYGLPYATSLRMGGLGYTSSAQSEISICFNKLETYIGTLEEARQRPYPKYEQIGLKKGDEYLQLNANLLQIDNEFYANIRPKRTALSGESALQALYRGGIEYLEVRLLDVDLFSPVGISESTIAFLQMFLCFCLNHEAPGIEDDECKEIDENLKKVVNEGRRPKLELSRNGRSILLENYAQDLLQEIAEFIPTFEQAYNSQIYSDTFELQSKKIYQSDLTPSAKVLALVSENTSILDAVKTQAELYKCQFLEQKLTSERLAFWQGHYGDSLAEQDEIEALDNQSFDEYLVEYFKKIKIQFK
jgi:glutamate--cysteine ligase